MKPDENQHARLMSQYSTGSQEPISHSLSKPVPCGVVQRLRYNKKESMPMASSLHCKACQFALCFSKATSLTHIYKNLNGPKHHPEPIIRKWMG